MASLNEPLRARLLALVEHQELSVGEISSVLQLPQSTTSRHLKALSDDHWLSSRREGTSRLYRLASEQFSDKRGRLWQLLRSSIQAHSGKDQRRLQKVLQQRQEASAAFFADAATEWDRLRVELFGPDLERRFLPALVHPEHTVLDLGCGTGRLARAFAPFAAQVIGVDASPGMVQAAKERAVNQPNVHFHQAQLQELPIASESVDLALMVLVLHYVSSPNRALDEVARVLRPGGRVLLVDMLPHSQDEHRGHMGQLWLGFSSNQLTSWLNPNFDPVRYTELEPEPQARGPGLFVCDAIKKTQ
ncbi:MAG TPA: metalloregulator ArsR/SmtB family transcription factor [Polyangiaceae bacterium]|nr:metalloregulator ArsR/SmtB family transcription factor [Polyangiaceae bacterium]